MAVDVPLYASFWEGSGRLERLDLGGGDNETDGSRRERVWCLEERESECSPPGGGEKEGLRPRGLQRLNLSNLSCRCGEGDSL